MITGNAKRTGRSGGIALLLLILLLLSGAEAGAQSLYSAALSLSGQYHSNVFAGQGGDPAHDFVTELAPSLRLNLIRPRDQLDMTYSFALQLYNEAQDPVSGDKLIGYSNQLLLGYQHQFSPRTTLTLTNRLIQGTESTLVRGAVGADGRLQAGLPLSSSAFVADWLALGVARQLSRTWRFNTGISGRVHRVYGLDEGDLALPHQYGLAWNAAAAWAYDQGEVNIGLDLGWGAWQTPDTTGVEHPLLHQAVSTLTVGWTGRLTERLTTSLSAGASVRLTQTEEAVAGAGSTTVLIGGEMTPGVAPVGRAGLNLELGRGRMFTLGYQHAYNTDTLLGGGALTGQADSAFARLTWRAGPWLLDGGGSYSYTRYSTTDGATITEGAMHWGGAEAGVTVGLLRGLDAGVRYRFDILEPASDGQVEVLDGYDRHLATVNIIITWPPPPVGQGEGLFSGFEI